MKNRSVISLFTLILVIFGLFAACAGASDSNSSSSGPSNSPNPTPPNSTPPQSASNYTVKFEANGGDPVPNSQNITHGEKVVPPSAMAKTDYGFGGWYKERACTNEWNFATNTVTSNITLYAQWDVNYHTVSFNADDGSPVPNQQAIAYGGKVVAPPAITKTGYGFGGWYKEADCINQWNFTSDTVNDDITLYAKWDMNYYTVKFNTNGGSPVPDSQSITHNGIVVQPPAMTKTGYGFGGWYKEAACTNEWNFDTNTVTGNITLYAQWNINYYTVSFNANGGEPVPNSQNIVHGGKVATPSAMTKTGYSFGGWYKEAACTNQWNFATDSVIGEITLYAKWNPPIIVSGDTLADKLQWLSTNAASNSSYILEVNADYENLATHNLLYSNKRNITIRLKGIGSTKTIALSNPEYEHHSLFIIENGVTLILDENLILLGKSGNDRPLVQVNSGGTLTMNQGVKITGNKNSGTTGRGVHVNGGTFIMSGGEISSNSNSLGDGGGMYVTGGTFTMSGGNISGNSAKGIGGGVYVTGGTFTMSGGNISGNSAKGIGGGVYVGGGTFTMSSGEISGNSTISYGGGVAVTDTLSPLYGGTFTMSGGKISDNSAEYGGGVWVSRTSGVKATFTMSGGEISGNTVSSNGGGVYVNDGGKFTKSSDGNITGYVSDMMNGNVVKNSSGVVQSNRGHAVYVDSSPVKRRETTAGSVVSMDSSKNGAAGGWE